MNPYALFAIALAVLVGGLTIAALGLRRALKEHHKVVN